MPKIMKKTISTKEAYDIIVDNELGMVSLATIMNWTKKNKFGKKIGGRWRIEEDKFLKFLNIEEEY